VFLCCFSDSERATGLGIAFCGSNVRVTSVVLHADVSEPADVEKCLLRLGASGIPALGKSIGLMFACMGRGRYFYNGAVGVESAVFKKLYPRVPLFGFFGNGEIGYDFPPMDGSGCRMDDSSSGGAACDAADTDVPQMYHSFTTIFVLLSFGQ